MSESLRQKTFKGAVWAFLEKIGTQVVHFLVTIVLARLLTPNDYGVIGMLAVFLSVSQLFIDCGFGSALIRKKDRTDEDLSTVFWYNLAVACACYVVLFCAAPAIAGYYKMPVLAGILRVVGFNLVVNALYTVQVTRLTAMVNFKLQAKVAILSCVVSGLVGVGMAFYGCGAWALVGQMMSASLFSGALFWALSGWRPQFVFSKTAFRKLFGFGSRIMAASVLHTAYTNIAPLIIGRKYSAADLGVYSRADSLVALPGNIFQSTLGRVIFPVLSSIQDDEPRLRAAYNKYLRVITSIVSPAMLLLAAVSEPLVLTLIGAKWHSCVPYMMILAIAWMLDPIIIVNLNMLYVKGRSDIVLKLEIIKKIIAIAIVVISVQFGIVWLCVGRVAYAFIALGLNLYVCSPFIGMSFWRQMREVWPVYACSFLSAGCAFMVSSVLSSIDANVWMNNLFRLVVAGLTGLSAYGALAYLLRFDIVGEGLILFNKARGRICR